MVSALNQYKMPRLLIRNIYRHCIAHDNNESNDDDMCGLIVTLVVYVVVIFITL